MHSYWKLKWILEALSSNSKFIYFNHCGLFVQVTISSYFFNHLSFYGFLKPQHWMIIFICSQWEQSNTHVEQICMICVNKLRAACDFKRVVLTSEEQLLEYVEGTYDCYFSVFRQIKKNLNPLERKLQQKTLGCKRLSIVTCLKNSLYIKV